MKSVTQFLHESPTNSIVLRECDDRSGVLAIAFESLESVATATDVTVATALEALGDLLGGQLDKTLPNNELPEPCPDTLDSSEVAHA